MNRVATSETQLQVGKKLTFSTLKMHKRIHFASVNNDLIYLQNLGVLEWQFLWNRYNVKYIFFILPPASSHLHSLQVENRASNSRLVVNGDDNGKFKLERVK